MGNLTDKLQNKILPQDILLTTPFTSDMLLHPGPLKNTFKKKKKKKKYLAFNFNDSVLKYMIAGACVNVANVLRAETFHLHSSAGEGEEEEEILQCETAGGTAQMHFLPSLESEQYGDSEHTLQTRGGQKGGRRGGVGGLILSSSPLFSLPLFTPP